MKKKKVLTTWWTGISVLALMMFQAMHVGKAQETKPPFSVRKAVAKTSFEGLDPNRLSPDQANQTQPVNKSGESLIEGVDPDRITKRIPSLSNLSSNSFRSVKLNNTTSTNKLSISKSKSNVVITLPAGTVLKSSTSLNSTNWVPVKTLPGSQTNGGALSLPIPTNSTNKVQFYRVFSVNQ